jgi:uncharacterized protein (TIGR00369 family)
LEQFEQKVRESFSRQSFMRTLVATMTNVSRGSLEIRFPFSPQLAQQNGFIHAGAITSIMDSACGYAAMTLAAEDADVLSVEFKVNLLAPALGDSFVARAQVKRQGRTLTICAADAFAIQSGEEKLIATMLATMINIIPSEPKR